MSDVAPEPPSSQASAEEGWKDAASNFVSARIELIKLEAKDAGQTAAKRGALLGVIAVCAVLIWLLVVAGLIGWISAGLSWPWYAVTLGAAGLHLLVAIIAGVLLKQPTAPSFPLTREEFSKDQAWLETLKNDPKSRS